ncbi:hypothetical protein HK102_006442, partial [Quaeritorhiza haematococci]
MPVVLKDFSWSETPTTIDIEIPVKGVLPSKADIYSNESYIKVNSAPYFFELDLSHSVNPEESVATVGNDVVRFSLKKTEPQLWGTAKYTPRSKEELRERRDAAVQKALARADEIRKSKSEERARQQRQLIEKQIEVERQARAKVQALKDQEKMQAEAALYEWIHESKKEETGESDDIVDEIASAAETDGALSANRHESTSIFDDVEEEEEEEDRDDAVGERGDDLDGEESQRDRGSSGSEDGGATSDVKETEVTTTDEDLEAVLGEDEMRAIMERVKRQMKPLIKKSQVDISRVIPPPRSGGREIEIDVSFTTRRPLPTSIARESEDAKWHARIKEAREAAAREAQAKAKEQAAITGGKDAEKSQDGGELEEMDAGALKDKGNKFYRVGNHLAAINAYTAALEVDPANVV